MTGTGSVVVVGGGAVGASVAYVLAAEGHDVRVLDRGAVGHGATAGSACMVTTSHAERMASPASLLEGLRALPDPAGPLAIRPGAQALGWLARFTRASLDREAARAGTELLVRLAAESVALHRAWAAEIGTGLVERGYLNVYLTPEGLEHGRAVARELAHLDVASRELDLPALAAFEPAVQGAAGAIHFPGDAHVDSLRFAQRVAEAARAAGARIDEGVDVFDLRREPGGLVLLTSRGDVRADRVVLAAGVGSAAFARALGIAVPITGAKGYNTEHPTPAPLLATPAFLAEKRVVATPLDGRVRLAGTLEIGSRPDAVDLRRIRAIEEAGATHVAGVAGTPTTQVWHGDRPMSADGMPLIGPLPADPRVVLATGHGMLGVTLGPVTGALVARVLRGEALEPWHAALRPERFRRLRR